VDRIEEGEERGDSGEDDNFDKWCNLVGRWNIETIGFTSQSLLLPLNWHSGSKPYFIKNNYVQKKKCRNSNKYSIMWLASLMLNALEMYFILTSPSKWKYWTFNSKKGYNFMKILSCIYAYLTYPHFCQKFCNINVIFIPIIKHGLTTTYYSAKYWSTAIWIKNIDWM
jgi:hypothetical protein